MFNFSYRFYKNKLSAYYLFNLEPVISMLIYFAVQKKDSVAIFYLCIAIPYRASTGPEQGFPCVVFPHREKTVFITEFPGDENRFFAL
jgi:hypothetical protein